MLSSSPLSQNLTDFAVSGDVTLAPSAAIATGVLLQADPGSQIVIGAGVCIGIGSVLHAHHGLLEIQVGTTIGAGVLVFGQGKIGVNACIGSGSTIIDPTIKADQVIPSGSLIGDKSRQSAADSSDTVTVHPVEEQTTDNHQEHSHSPPSAVPNSTDAPETDSFPQPQVYGRANLDQLLDRLLPHRQSYNKTRPKPGEISTMGDEQSK